MEYEGAVMSNPALETWAEYSNDMDAKDRWRYAPTFFAGYACGAAGVRQNIDEIVAAFKATSLQGHEVSGSPQPPIRREG